MNLTFAGVGGGLRSLRVSVETGFTFLTLASFGVVETVAHASAALARLAPRRPIKMAALSVSVTLALWSERKGGNEHISDEDEQSGGTVQIILA